MSGQRTSTAIDRQRTSPNRRRNRRRLVALVAAVGLLGPALAASPALASDGQVTVQAILNSSDYLAAVMGTAGSDMTTPVTYEVFEAAGGGVVPVASVVVSGLGDVNIPLASGDYKISASAPGYLTSWFTSAAGATIEPWSDLIGYHQTLDFASAGVITVDTANPENSTWAFQAWTVLYEHATSISGAVADDLDYGADSLAAGVTVGLYDAAGAPGSDAVATTVTDEHGYYSFNNPPVPGSYKVRFDHTLNGVPMSQWWPETTHRGEAEAIALTEGTNYALAYGIFATPPQIDPQRILALSGQPVPGQTLTAVPDYIEASPLGGSTSCSQRYTWLIDGERVPDAFGDTFVIPGGTTGTSISARLDIVGIGCQQTAMLSNPIGPIDASLTLTGAEVEVVPVAQDGSTDVALTFGNVETSGTTTVTSSTDGPAPTGFSLRTDPVVYYFIETTAVFDTDAQVRVCISFDTTTAQAGEQHLYHYVDGSWADITDTDPAVQVPGQVCGLTSSFSPFVIGQPDWPFRGFLQPVDNAPTVNSMKAGAAVPITFGLGGPRGLDILESGSPASAQVSCTSAAVVDNVELTVAAGGSSLSYDAVSDTYSYVWKTQKAWAGTCRQFVMTLADGTVHTALFRFMK